MRGICVAVVLLVVAGCGEKEEEGVLARVDDAVITAEALRLNYEFGHGHLRRGDDPRTAYLDFMIAEQLLAQEAARRGLDTARAVVHALRTLREELLIERVFEAKVLDRIEVTDEEIRREVERNAVSFRFRFLPALSEAEALRLRDAVAARGFDAVAEAQRRALAELGVPVAELESPYVKADDVDPVMLAVIRDLPVGTLSEPVRYGDQWFLFEVTDVRRQPLADFDYRAQAPTARKVVYNRKAMEMGAAFVADTMTPLDVRTKREGFDVLQAALWDWYRDRTPERNLLHYIEEQRLEAPYVRRLVDAYALPLVHFGEEHWTIRDFLAHFTPGRYVLRADDPGDFRARLSDVVALVVRDEVFLRMARRERLDDDPEYRRTLALWKDKWLFQELRRLLLDSTAFTDARLQAFYARKDRETEGDFRPFERLTGAERGRLRRRMMQEYLAGFADSLRARHRVAVNRAMLDTLTLSESSANPYMTVHLFKNNANKMPFPIVDPNWRWREDPAP